MNQKVRCPEWKECEKKRCPHITDHKYTVLCSVACNESTCKPVIECPNCNEALTKKFKWLFRVEYHCPNCGWGINKPFRLEEGR
jgi:hypothetical protein